MAEQIEVFSRHCFLSDASRHKKRFERFSRELCYQNLLETMDFQRANLTFFYDAAKGEEHFLKRETRHPVIRISEGTEAGSFLRLLEEVEKRQYDPETILYFVEDDYLHRPGWVDVLLEGMHLPGVEYATLYDHKDKYFSRVYRDLVSRIFVSPSCHWRTIPSTTQTFAVRWKTLQRDLPIHRKFSTEVAISKDHEKFCALSKRGSLLVSPMPGWSTHAEPEFASPCVDWETVLHGV